MGFIHGNIPFLFVLILLLFSHQPVASGQQDVTNQLCDKVSLEKAECESIFKLFPELAIATDLHSLTEVTLKQIISEAGEIQGKIRMLFKESSDKSIQQLLNGCSEYYENAISNIDGALSTLNSKGLDSKDYADANIQISGAMTYAQTCDDGFEEQSNGKSPVTDLRTKFDKLCSVALALLKDLAEEVPSAKQ